MSQPIQIKGFRSIEECLNFHPDRIQRIVICGPLTPREDKLISEARRLKIPIEKKGSDEHSLIAYLKDFQYAEFDELLSDLKDKMGCGSHPSVLVLDGITDAHNLGAIVRTAAFMGIDGIILPEDRSAGVTEGVFRISSGGMEHVSICRVTNLVSALKKLQDSGFWVVGFSEHSSQSLTALKRDFCPVLVIGNEEKGMRPLLKENCDYLVRLEGKGPLKSLNASVAASLAMAWAVDLF